MWSTRYARTRGSVTRSLRPVHFRQRAVATAHEWKADPTLPPSLWAKSEYRILLASTTDGAPFVGRSIASIDLNESLVQFLSPPRPRACYCPRLERPLPFKTRSYDDVADSICSDCRADDALRCDRGAAGAGSRPGRRRDRSGDGQGHDRTRDAVGRREDHEPGVGVHANSDDRRGRQIHVQQPP